MKKKIFRIIAVFMAINIFVDAIFPTAALALTGGPKQPEVEGFTPIGTSEMVNAFTGDFNYNIPLLDVGGYPINLSYQSGITTDQEASWVGLGWSLNPGVIERNMRSLPDDFRGDEVIKEFNVKPNATYGIKAYVDYELAGLKVPKTSLNFGLGLTYNNYTGYAFSLSADLRMKSGESSKLPGTAGLGLTAGDDGIGISPSISFSKKVGDMKTGDKVSTKIGLAFNTRGGLQALTLSASGSKKTDGVDKTVGGNSSSLSYATPTYVTPSGHAMLNLSLSISGTVGLELFSAHPDARLEGFLARQILLNKTETYQAFGYLNSQAANTVNSLQDFNREKEGSFNEQVPALPLTNFTYDVYNVSGQGIGGTYRPHRSDIGVLHDNRVVNTSAGPDISAAEVGAASSAHLGVNITVNESNSISGKWEKDNEAAKILAFQTTNGDPLYETTYFKQAGEKNAESEESFFNDMGGFYPVSVSLNHKPESVPTKKEYSSYAPSTDLTHSIRTKRARRNELISTLTADEAAKYGEISKIESYSNFNVNTTANMPVFTPTLSIDRNADYRKGHHISQITTYRSDGAKYVYGIPAYNVKQDERTFAVEDDYSSPGDEKITQGIVTYFNGDDVLGNPRGLDNYFERTVLPAYAHSYLLTEILSTDYVDVTGNGPTDDDLGTYTKINYTRVNDDYRWRVPYEANRANFNEGLKSVTGNELGDNKGSYVYGQKELWYIHSIETKNYVAKFITGNRSDGYGVANEHGGFSSNSKTKKLKEIQLYSKIDLKTNTNASPIKTVHFEYNYSLCKEIGNNIRKVNSGSTVDEDNFTNDGGKLTLTKVYFTYGKSEKGKLSPYQFEYDAETNNPDYNLKAYDRWGNYKENTANHPTAEFPYTDQTASGGVYAADINAAPWHLKKIKLPSGGEISVQYESDDYAYVQNKRAMQMFKVVGVSKTEPGTLPTNNRNKLYDDDLASRNYLIFELPNHDMSTAEIERDLFREKDGTLIDELYFRFKVDLGGVLAPSSWEYVSGYAEIDMAGPWCGAFEQGGIKYGWVKLQEEKIKDKMNREPKVNQISQAAWAFTRMHLPLLAYGNQKRVPESALLQVIKAMARTLKQLITLPNGIYNQMRMEKLSSVFDTDKSFIRLYNPVNKKKGGGIRVKQLLLSDKWQTITDNAAYSNSDYGQVYDYTTTDEYGNKISSGVAAYEPILGGDENPFRQPAFYSIKPKWAASQEFYQEEPFGESFFPAPSVGYSKVTVKTYYPNNTKVVRHGTGAVVNEFYTAKDFPTITRKTDLDVERKKPNPVLKLLKIRSRDFMTASQGFVVELNDMHGKPKATAVYAEGKSEPISGVRYVYKTTEKPIGLPAYVNEEVKVGTLDNDMLVMEHDGTVHSQMVGVDYDFVTDMNEQETINRTASLGGNMETFFIGLIPGVVPTVIPSYGQERTRFRSAVTTKIINRYGLLDETIAFDQGSVVSTKNVMLDAETGEVLLTETKNQFNDPLYAFTYPAHIAYDGMGPAYKNVNVKIAADEVVTPSAYFIAGDELLVYNAMNSAFEDKVWVKKATATVFQVVDRNGYTVNLSGKYLRVLRSGRRNQSSTPIASVVSKISPLVEINGTYNLDIQSRIGVISSEASEYKDEWGLFCECGIKEGDPFNPYVRGTRGNWRKCKTYVQLTGRTQDKLNGNTNVREDGTYTSFSPFWKAPQKNTQDPWQKSLDTWKMTSEVTVYSPYGMELENKNALDIYSSAVYGYNNSLPLTVAANAKYKEVAFDGFEDYDFDACKSDHFSYKLLSGNNNDKLEKGKSHSGRTSIKVAPNSELELKKTLIKCSPNNQ